MEPRAAVLFERACDGRIKDLDAMIRKIGPLVGLGFVFVLMLSLFSGLSGYFQSPPESSAEHEFHKHAKQTCGGCQLQHVDDEAYRDYLISRVSTALAQHDLATDIREPHLSPPNSRRRASLRGLRVGQSAVIGFNAAKSHRIVDMQENHILRPELLALVAPLRQLLGRFLPPRRTAEIQLTLLDQGPEAAAEVSQRG